MKALENIDLNKDDEVYNYIFAEGSSEDDDFEVSQSNSMNKDSFDSDFYQEESISEFEEGSQQKKPKKSKKKANENKLGAKMRVKKSLGKSNLNLLLREPEKLDNEEIKLTGLKRNRRKIPEEELMDLDMLDIDAIDEKENMDDEEIESSDSGNASISENSEEFIPNLSNKKKKLQENFLTAQEETEKLKENLPLIDKSGEDFSSRQKGANEEYISSNEEKDKESDESCQSEKKNRFRIKAKPKDKKIRYTKKFIDYDEDEEFIRKKKKIKETLYRGKKSKAGKKIQPKKNDNFISSEAAYANTNNINILKNREEEAGAYSNLAKPEMQQRLNNNIPITKKITRSQETKKFQADMQVIKQSYDQNNRSTIESANLKVTDFNITINKSCLDLKKIFDKDYINSNIKSCNTDKIVLNKLLLCEERENENNYFENTQSVNSSKNAINNKVELNRKTSIGKNNSSINNITNNNNLVSSNTSKTATRKKSETILSSSKIEDEESDYIAGNSSILSNKEKIKKSQGFPISDKDREQISVSIDKYEEASDIEIDNLEEEFNPNEENYQESEYNEESDLMRYNDKNYRKKQQKFYDEDYVVGNQTKKTTAAKSSQNNAQAPVKLSYHEKLSQKDLLYEAIFTELYNIKSLEDMQRLEELNKRDVNYSSKKQFSEFIKTVRKTKKKQENTLNGEVTNTNANSDDVNAALRKSQENTKFSLDKSKNLNYDPNEVNSLPKIAKQFSREISINKKAEADIESKLQEIDQPQFTTPSLATVPVTDQIKENELVIEEKDKTNSAACDPNAIADDRLKKPKDKETEEEEKRMHIEALIATKQLNAEESGRDIAYLNIYLFLKF